MGKTVGNEEGVLVGPNWLGLNASFRSYIGLHLNVFENSFQEAFYDLKLVIFGVSVKTGRIRKVEYIS